MNAPVRTARPAVPPLAPGSLPLLGHIIPLARGGVEYLRALRAQGDVVRIRLGTSDTYVINHPELMNRVLVTQASQFDRGRVFTRSRPFTGNGLGTSDGDFHLRQRRMMMPAFHVSRLPGYADVMLGEATALAQRWTPGQRVALHTEMHGVMCAITTQAMFGGGLSAAAIADVTRHINALINGLIWRVLAPKLSWVPIPVNRRFDRGAVALRRLVTDYVRAYLADPVDRGDLLSMLVAARDEDTGQPMGIDQLRDEVMSILIGGTETAATTLSWLFYELGRHPELDGRLAGEIASVLRGRGAGFADLPALGFTRQLVNETLRLYGPGWIVMRTANSQVDLGGVSIPAGADIICSLTAMHRDPGYYPGPDRFDPGRWAAPGLTAPFIPFGSGRHKCIGDRFAMTAVIITVATVAARWRLLPVPGKKVRAAAVGIIRPVNLMMTAQPRTPG
jgi:cytochrome P450